jgi:hypothetical protein
MIVKKILRESFALRAEQQKNSTCSEIPPDDQSNAAKMHCVLTWELISSSEILFVSNVMGATTTVHCATKVTDSGRQKGGEICRRC